MRAHVTRNAEIARRYRTESSYVLAREYGITATRVQQIAHMHGVRKRKHPEGTWNATGAHRLMRLWLEAVAAAGMTPTEACRRAGVTAKATHQTVTSGGLPILPTFEALWGAVGIDLYDLLAERSKATEAAA